MTTDEPRYEGARLTAALAALPGWQHRDSWLTRQYTTDGWRSTMMAVNAIAFLAEAANHHPDLAVHWGSIEVNLQTHSAGGITDKDLQLAAQIEALVCWQPTDGFPGLEGQADGWISG